MRKPFQEMSEPEVREWMAETRNDLVGKKAREREILDSRARKRKHSITDVILERDQILLQEVVHFLDHIESMLDVLQQEEEAESAKDVDLVYRVSLPLPANKRQEG